MKARFKSEFFRVLVAVLLLGCVACQPPVIDQALSQIENYEVTAKDIPTGWKFTSQDWGQDFGGDSHFVAYGIDNDDIIRLTHTISIYPDEKQAETAYSQWEEKWFKGVMQKWPGADFVPSDPNDAYKFECQQVLSDKSLIGCLYLQRHKQLISFVLVNLRENVMTFTQLNDVLKAVDERLNNN